MAWTAPTGLGPGTVALSLKVLIVVMFYAHERLGICTAQPEIVLPQALQDNLDELIRHFCTSGCTLESEILNCEQPQQSSNPLCLQICISEACNAHCWFKAGTSLCTGNQIQLCGYSNADVCQSRNGDRTSICVYTSDSSPAFCICQPNPSTSYTRCNPQDAVAQATTAQAIASQYPETQGTPAQGITAQVTTSIQQDDNGTNVAAIVLGSLFALLLLLVIIRAVILCLRRQGRLPSCMIQAAKPAELPGVELEASSSVINGRQLPEPPPDFDYAYIPYLPTTNPSLENQAYASVQEEEGSSHDVMNGHEFEETTDGIKNTYFGWIPTSEQKTENEASETTESQGVSSATGDVPLEDNSIPFPLTQHKVGNITSDGSEIPKVNPTAANH